MSRRVLLEVKLTVPSDTDVEELAERLLLLIVDHPNLVDQPSLSTEPTVRWDRHWTPA